MLVRDGSIVNLDLGHTGRQGRLVSVCQDSLGAVWLLTEHQLGRYTNGEIHVWNFDSRCRSMAAETCAVLSPM